MKKLLFLPVLLAGLLLFAFAPEDTGYKIGDKVEDFKLKNVDGKMVSLADYSKARGFIVIFTCNHCPFSVAYEDRIIALHQKYEAKGYPVVAINPNDPTIVPDDSYENMVIRAKEKSFPFKYLSDETQEVARMYGASRTPHVFILRKEKDGLVVKYIGAIDDNTDSPEDVTKRYVETAIDQLSEGKDVLVPFTKAIGCTVKWKK